MADLSLAFDPTLPDATSDVASSAMILASDASSKASDALSRCAVISNAASKASSIAHTASSKAVAAQSKASDASSAAVKLKRVVVLKPYDEASAISTGDGKMYFAIPSELSGMNLVTVGGHLYTAATSGVVSCQIHNAISAVDMLSTKLTWDATEKDTNTADAVAVINTGADGVIEGDEIRIDIDAAASGAKGMEIRLGFQSP